MPGISREGIDIAGGLIIQGSPNVLIENSPAVRIGDAIMPHSSGIHAYNPIMISGSNSVLVNNIPVCREGDLASCGDTSTGSSTVFSG